MQKEFSISNDKVIINFTAKYCKTFESLLESEGFRRVLESYLRVAKRKNSLSYRYLKTGLNSGETSVLRYDLSKILKFLTVMSVEEICEFNSEYKGLLEKKDEFIRFVEEFYLFWRRLERYTLIHGGKVENGLAQVSFTEANDGLSKLILRFYRKIEKNVLGVQPKVFRQIPAGGNSCIMINDII